MPQKQRHLGIFKQDGAGRVGGNLQKDIVQELLLLTVDGLVGIVYALEIGKQRDRLRCVILSRPCCPFPTRGIAYRTSERGVAVYVSSLEALG